VREIASELPFSTSYLICSKSHCLAGQRAFPEAQQQFFEMVKTVGLKFNSPFALDLREYLVDFRISGASTSGKADNP